MRDGKACVLQSVRWQRAGYDLGTEGQQQQDFITLGDKCLGCSRLSRSVRGVSSWCPKPGGNPSPSALSVVLQSVQLRPSLLQHHSSKASTLWHSAFFTVQLSHPYMATGQPIEREMATHSSLLGWKIPLTEETGGLQSMVVTKSRTWLSTAQWLSR